MFSRPKLGGPEAMRARLEGAMAKRRLRGWNPPLENINALVASGGPRLLARSRELVVTNGYAANACEAFAANLVGDGIKPSSLIGDADLRDQVQKLWLAWTDEADADGLTDFYGLQAILTFGHRDDPDRRFGGGSGRDDLLVDLGGVPQNEGSGGKGDLVDRTEGAAKVDRPVHACFAIEAATELPPEMAHQVDV